MKNKILFSLALSLLFGISLTAQEKAKQEQVVLPPDSLLLQLAADTATPAKTLTPEPEKLTNYLRLYGKVGYAAMLDNTSIVNKKSDANVSPLLSNRLIPGGPGLGIGFGYDLEYRYLRFSTGIELNWLRSTSKYAFDANRPMAVYQNEQPLNMLYTYRFGYLNETRNIVHVGVPVLIGAQFDRYFFMVGARAGYNILGNATTFGNYDVTAYDPQLIQTLGNNQQLGLQTYSLDKHKHKLDLKQPELSVLAEFGVDLDEWLQYVPKKKKKGRNAKPSFRESLHYKVSLFAEYEVLNQNGMAKNNNAVEFASANTVPVSDVNTVLSIPDASGNLGALNNLFVGAKFAIQFQIPEKKPVAPPVKKPRPVKQRQEQKRTEVSTHLNGMVYNAETMRPLKADIIINDMEGFQQFASESDSLKGTFKTTLPVGKYHIVINKQGYMPFEDDVEFSVEALTFYLQPVKRGNTYTIRNLYFDTNATTIQPQSEKSLNDLFTFLKENPEVRIKLIGHTDSVGKDEDNQVLSDGRAKSVRQEMINRGIEEDRMEAEGRGESEPIDTNDTEEGRQHNRRVVVEIL